MDTNYFFDTDEYCKRGIDIFIPGSDRNTRRRNIRSAAHEAVFQIQEKIKKHQREREREREQEQEQAGRRQRNERVELFLCNDRTLEERIATTYESISTPAKILAHSTAMQDELDAMRYNFEWLHLSFPCVKN